MPKTAVFAGIVWFAVILVVAYGYIINIVTLATAEISIVAMTGVEILRIIGVFIPPLGAIMGLFV